jgi:hypothetical protein
MRKLHAGVEPRRFAATAIACALIFAGSFALGREGRSAGSHREAGPFAVSVVSVGSPIPAHLTSAPPIQIEAAATPARNPVEAGKAATRQTIAHARLAESRAIVAPVLATSRPPAAVSPQPAAEAPAASPQQPSAPSAAPPASTQGSPSAARSGVAPPSETGKSFDTSG